MICQGNCGNDVPPHEGRVRTVHVQDSDMDWGEWDYCESAIAEDRKRGFTVSEVDAVMAASPLVGGCRE